MIIYIGREGRYREGLYHNMLYGKNCSKDAIRQEKDVCVGRYVHYEMEIDLSTIREGKGITMLHCFRKGFQWEGVSNGFVRGRERDNL